MSRTDAAHVTVAPAASALARSCWLSLRRILVSTPEWCCRTRNSPAPCKKNKFRIKNRRPRRKARELVSVVLADTEDTWGQIFSAAGSTYEQPKLVLFKDAVQTECGFGQSAAGPFYCPADRKVYIDLSFYQELQQRFGAPGDFAQAYVIAHEIGHHVQTLMGISEKTQAARSRASEAEANALSVRQELQADCFAGLWAHTAGACATVFGSWRCRRRAQCR